MSRNYKEFKEPSNFANQSLSLKPSNPYISGGRGPKLFSNHHRQCQYNGHNFDTESWLISVDENRAAKTKLCPKEVKGLQSKR